MLPRAFSKLSSLFTALLLLAACAVAAEPRVRVTLSSPTVGVGETVEFEVRVDNGRPTGEVVIPNVEGLEIRGRPRFFSGFNATLSNVVHYGSFTYTLVPKREGKFTIPELEVQVDGQRLKTQPVTLTVTPGDVANEAGGLAFARLWLEKTSLYVGEVASLEVRLYLDARANWDQISKPVLKGDGFTTQSMDKFARRQVQMGEKTYILFSFHTIIMPGKAGKLNVGPVPFNAVVSKPEPAQPGFSFLRPRVGLAENMSVSAPAIEIDVKPLPVEGRPKDFAGAIGKFEFSASGTPDRVKLGEPVSMKLTIKGHGNFDRIGQPPLADPDGWTTYTAKQQFDGGENGGTVGVKTFELPVTPTAKKSTMPVFAFSFFDPEAGKYVTLNNAAAPLTVEGEPLVAAKDPAPSVAIPAAQPKIEPKAPAVQDILANLPELGAVSAGFGPRMPPAILFGTMFAPLPLILAVMAWRARKRDGKAARIAALRKERAALMARVKNAGDRAEVLDAAVKALQIQSTLDSGQSGTEWDLVGILDSRKLDAGDEKAVRELFEARNELLYAGASRGGDRISDTERDRVLETLAILQRTQRK